MSTQSILEKAAALQNGPEPENETNGKKRQGVWETAEEFIDKGSGLGVIIRKRIRGRPAYSISFVHFDDRGPNRYIPFPLEDLGRPLHEMSYLLMQKAEEWIEKHPLRSSGGEKRKDKRKGKDKKERRDREPGGLSSLSKQDAEKQGKTHIGKTERKRRKKAG